MRSLIWFRRDLRIADNSALHHAAKASKSLVALFVITPEQWKQHDDAPAKVSFWIRNLKLLSADLAKLNIPLLIEVCPTWDAAPKLVAKVAADHDCDQLFFNREYEINEVRRDDATTERCQANGMTVTAYHDRIIVPPRDIATKDGRFYSVFTPYRKVWDTKALDQIKVLAKPKALKPIDVQSSPVPDSVDGFDIDNDRADLWLAGEKEAQKKLKKFADHVAGYKDWRDMPSVSGTSLLSPYLAAGVVSPRQCMAMAIKAGNGHVDANEGIKTWVSELTWRDFYTHVMTGFPRVSMHRPFKAKTENVAWRYDKADFEAWCTGQTGYPIVDAGMRQLNQTGWMHNRLRMVTAMFLTKNLLIDWRWGEKYFMERLIDGDLAANNGGWQWSASTGTDAVPYFRIFSPFSQSKRFDKDGKFIKKLCPELESIPSPALHDEKKLAIARADLAASYPDYIVNYRESRARALAAFKK